MVHVPRSVNNTRYRIISTLNAWTEKKLNVRGEHTNCDVRAYFFVRLTAKLNKMSNYSANYHVRREVLRSAVLVGWLVCSLTSDHRLHGWQAAGGLAADGSGHQHRSGVAGARRRLRPTSVLSS